VDDKVSIVRLHRSHAGFGIRLGGSLFASKSYKNKPPPGCFVVSVGNRLLTGKLSLPPLSHTRK